ncbi:MAG: hypothetical protein PHD48_02405 [Alphaproteobacteria bacterium]|nr:hypothetical protein [Alphaproteobacteria bacterium]
MSTTDASNYNSTLLDATAGGVKLLYQRDVSLPLNSTLSDAADLGALTTNSTQLDVKSRVSRQNPNHFYKFELEGNSIKMNFTNNTGSSGLRVQLLNSSGKVIADSSTSASDELQAAYKELNSSDGLDAKAGDYYVKVTFDTAQARSVPQTYSLGLYSGTRFTSSYQTTAKPQTSTKQTVLQDNTMTYAMYDAYEYTTKSTHIANETKADAVNIGWVYENKTALSVSSLINSVASDQWYNVTLQKGDALKIAFNNHTNTTELRVQLYDSSGTQLLADSEGTEEQKAAYEALTGSSGLTAEASQYLIKVSYAAGADKKQQVYDFKVYSGATYDTLYTTTVGAENAETALANGHLVPGYSQKSVAASYLSTVANGEDINIMEEISQYI